MSHIPDCRADEYYNYDALTEENKQFVDGFDFARKTTIESFFQNLDIYADELEKSDTEADILRLFERSENLCQIMEEALKDYHERERDMLITSLIDSQPDADED